MNHTLRSPRRTIGIAVIAAALAVSASTATGVAHAGGKTAVPQGIGASALPGTAFGSTPPDTLERVSFILQPRNLRGLEGQVEAGMPRGYLSVSQFAAQYGQTSRNIAALVAYLGRYGITSTVLPDGLDVETTGNAGAYDAALSVQQRQYHLAPAPPQNGHRGRPAMTVHGTTQSPLLPRNLASFVEAVLGLSNYPTFASDSVRVPSSLPQDLQLGNLTPEDFASRYDLDPLYGEGATGAGSTIGIVTLAGLDPAGPPYFWSNVLRISTKPDRITLDNVDGGAPVSEAGGSGETALDVEQSGALAPQANIVVYQAPNTDYGFVDAFYQAASDNVADSVSASWGESETAIQATVADGLESAGYARAFDAAYLELAAQGQSTFVSSGDYGAYTAAEDIGTTNLSAGNPDSSPWVTSAGGTTLPGTIPLATDANGNVTVAAQIPTERTWGWDWLWPFYSLFGAPSEAAFAEAEPIGSGGGFSIYEPTPAYQRGVPGTHDFSAVEYLTPTDYQSTIYSPGFGLTFTLPYSLPTAWDFNGTPGVTRGAGNGRATPDVSADADPFTGYLLYDPDASPALQQGWGGTSFVAPQLNGSTALIDSALGRRVGFWNPAVYRFAMQRNSPFTPLDDSSTSNDDLYYTGTRGHVFNVGSGLGTPDLARLAADFAAPPRR